MDVHVNKFERTLVASVHDFWRVFLSHSTSATSQLGIDGHKSIADGACQEVHFLVLDLDGREFD